MADEPETFNCTVPGCDEELHVRRRRPTLEDIDAKIGPGLHLNAPVGAIVAAAAIALDWAWTVDNTLRYVVYLHMTDRLTAGDAEKGQALAEVAKMLTDESASRRARERADQTLREESP